MVIVSRLTPGYYTEQVVVACDEAGWDPRFCTTLCADGPDLPARVLRMAGMDRRRRLQFVEPSRLRTYPWREALRLLVGKLSRNEVLNDSVFYWMRDGFDAWVARQVKPPLRMVYAHETECLATFHAAKRHGVATVLDLPSPEHDYVEDLLHAEYAKFPELLTPARRHFRSLQAARTARRLEECKLADVVVANSSLTARTWANAGVDPRKIHVATYGAPEPAAGGGDGGSRGEGPLRLVWAGTFSVRKGAHYMLAAWRKWASSNNAVLDVYGTVRLPEAVLRGDSQGIAFRGPVPQPQLFEAFQQADLLVFPTLCDGFGLVVPEALSRGLPVLTTRQAGAADMIRHEANGLIIGSADEDALVGALQWAASHRDALRAMRDEALRTAAATPWSAYRRRIREILTPVCVEAA